MKKKVSISDLDVQPISDEELRAYGPQIAGAGSTYECCNNSDDVIIIICDAS
jgi:hypothetical protein